MPIRVADTDILRRHAAVAHRDGSSRHDSGSGANQAAAADFNFSCAFPGRPNGESDFLIRRGNDGGAVSQNNRPAKYFYLPGLHKYNAPAKVFKLRRQKIPRILFLKFFVKALYVIWTIIPFQWGTCIYRLKRVKTFAENYRQLDLKLPPGAGIFTDFAKPKTDG